MWHHLASSLYTAYVYQWSTIVYVVSISSICTTSNLCIAYFTTTIVTLFHGQNISWLLDLTKINSHKIILSRIFYQSMQLHSITHDQYVAIAIFIYYLIQYFSLMDSIHNPGSVVYFISYSYVLCIAFLSQGTNTFHACVCPQFCPILHITEHSCLNST